MTDILPPHGSCARRRGPARLPGWVRIALISAGLSIPMAGCRPTQKATTRAKSHHLGVLPVEPELKSRPQQKETENDEEGESEAEAVLEGPDGSFLYGAPEVKERDVTRVPDLVVSPEADEID